MKKYNGFTLVELMTVVAVIGILSTVAAPYMQIYTSNSSSKSLISALTIDILFARNHAVSHSRMVKMIPTGSNPTSIDADDTGASTFTPIPGGVNWGLGWSVFEDNNDNDKRDIDERIIRSQPSFGSTAHISSGPGSHITSGSEVVVDSGNPIGFDTTGFATTTGALTIANFGCAGDNARIIQINQIGQVISTVTQCPSAFTEL
jgi:type IV fimbrial biogenesis protein FimT